MKIKVNVKVDVKVEIKLSNRSLLVFTSILTDFMNAIPLIRQSTNGNKCMSK